MQCDRALLPDSKSGPRTIWLGIHARKVLVALPRTSSPLVLPGRSGRTLVHSLASFWCKVRRVAELETLRLHDLRHSFATIAIESGENERTVADLLGHADLVTTSAYVHMTEAPIAQAAERVGAHLANALRSDAASTNAADREQPPSLELAARRKPVRKSTDDQAPKSARLAVRRFLGSRLSLPAFCEAEGLDEATFRSTVIAWRRHTSANRRGVTR